MSCLAAGLRRSRGLVEAQSVLQFLVEQSDLVVVVRVRLPMRCPAAQPAKMAWPNRALLPRWSRMLLRMATDAAQVRLGEILIRSFFWLERVLVRLTVCSGLPLLLRGVILRIRTKVARRRCGHFRPQLNFAQTVAACPPLARAWSSSIPPMELSIPVVLWRPYPTFENEL